MTDPTTSSQSRQNIDFLPAPRRFRLNPACKAQLVIFGQIAQQFGQLEAVDAITRLIREGGLSHE